MIQNENKKRARKIPKWLFITEIKHFDVSQWASFTRTEYAHPVKPNQQMSNCWNFNSVWGHFKSSVYFYGNIMVLSLLLQPAVIIAIAVAIACGKLCYCLWLFVQYIHWNFLNMFARPLADHPMNIPIKRSSRAQYHRSWRNDNYSYR